MPARGKTVGSERLRSFGHPFSDALQICGSGMYARYSEELDKLSLKAFDRNRLTLMDMR